MNDHWNRSIGLLAGALTLSAGAPAVSRGGNASLRPGPAPRPTALLPARIGGGAHPTLLTEADRQHMRIRTALFTDRDRQLMVMRTTLFTPQDQQRMAVRTAAFQVEGPPIPASRPDIGLAGR